MLVNTIEGLRCVRIEVMLQPGHDLSIRGPTGVTSRSYREVTCAVCTALRRLLKHLRRKKQLPAEIAPATMHGVQARAYTPVVHSSKRAACFAVDIVAHGSFDIVVVFRKCLPHTIHRTGKNIRRGTLRLRKGQCVVCVCVCVCVCV